MTNQTLQDMLPAKKQNLRKHIHENTPEAIKQRYEQLLSNKMLYGELDSDVVVLDTETTGVSYNHDELTQIAAARMRNGEITEWFVTFVNPGKPIPEEVARLTDIHDEDVANAPLPSEALTDLVNFVGDSSLVAHNAAFDRTFITKHKEGSCLKENLWIDSLDLARIALPRLKSHRLLDLARAFDAPVSTHRADADVEALCQVYRILLGAVGAMPLPLLCVIADMSDEQTWPTVAVFKYFSSEKQKAQDPTGSSRFNIRDLRTAHPKTKEKTSKIDADDIAANPQKELKFPDQEEVAAAFTESGLVGSLYTEYEARHEQEMMAEAVRAAFEGSTNLAVEAGTGVGKSMAYLVPAALTARANNITVGVATKTNALLDQLVHKELPALRQSLNTCYPDSSPLTFTALKGFSHYPCLRQVDRLVQEGPQTREVAGKQIEQAPSLAALLSFIEQSEYDDIDSLKLDYRALHRFLFTTTSRDCLRRKCPFFGTMCFVHGARKQAEQSDIVVTNHSLLFCNTVADGGLLPPIRYWILDEAHNAEAEARQAFSLELAAEELLRLSNRVSSSEPKRNIFVRAERRLGAALDDSSLFFGLTTKARNAGKELSQATAEFTEHMKDLLYFAPSKGTKGYEYVDLWLNDEIRASDTFKTLASFAKEWNNAAEKMVTACQNVVAYLEDIDEAAEIQREVATIALDLKDMLHTSETILFSMPPTYAYAATLSKKRDHVAEKLQALLFNVGQRMNESLFTSTHSIVFSSATLTIDGSFNAFASALGLNETEHSQTSFCEIGSSYDFDQQMTVYVPDDIPEPNDPAYMDALQRLLVEAHRAQEGSMLTLFTNRREMEKCYDVVQAALKADNLRVVCQKWGVSIKGLRDDFLADEHLSLFALKNFWEGFDAPGATLKGVVIAKLPFSKPTDPLSCERAQRDDQAWRNYVLPNAVIEVKQAAGRLIRSSKDKGCLILTDRRLLTKSYGRVFLNSLPSATIKICSMAQIAEDIAQSSH